MHFCYILLAWCSLKVKWVVKMRIVKMDMTLFEAFRNSFNKIFLAISQLSNHI